MPSTKGVEIDFSEELNKLVDNDTNQQPIDQDKLVVIFYQKQDYEPFALPMFFPVLADINMKLELQKCDMVVSKTIESIIMLVTPR